VTAYNEYTDQELLILSAKDNPDAFDTLYFRYWEDMYKTAFAILKDADCCKDIIQDVFIWLWQHRHTLQILHLKSYLRAAIKFKVANYIRSGNVRESFFKELASVQLPVHSPAEDQVEFKQLKGIVLQAISDLPEKCREIFQLSRDEELSNREIAEKLHISVKTVENQMTIALRRVRQATEPHLAAVVSLLLISLHNYPD
jgi:RNA polymerase sigma-70 factor (family 1)